jgi:hypothetical protein
MCDENATGPDRPAGALKGPDESPLSGPIRASRPATCASRPRPRHRSRGRYLPTTHQPSQAKRREAVGTGSPGPDRGLSRERCGGSCRTPLGPGPDGPRPHPLSDSLSIGLQPIDSEPWTRSGQRSCGRATHWHRPTRIDRNGPRASPGHESASAGRRLHLAFGKRGVKCHPDLDLSREISSNSLPGRTVRAGPGTPVIPLLRDRTALR